MSADALPHVEWKFERSKRHASVKTDSLNDRIVRRLFTCRLLSEVLV